MEGVRAGGSGDRSRSVRLKALAAAALLAGALTLVSLAPGEAEPGLIDVGTRLVSPAGLARYARSLGRPLYWAGRVPGSAIELSDVGTGDVEVRYLPAGASPTEAPTAVLTVGTYQLADPVAATEAFAASPGSFVRRRGGRSVAASASNPTSAYFASSDGRAQVEVYDPRPGRALRLALSSRVRALR